MSLIDKLKTEGYEEVPTTNEAFLKVFQEKFIPGVSAISTSEDLSEVYIYENVESEMPFLVMERSMFEKALPGELEKHVAGLIKHLKEKE